MFKFFVLILLFASLAIVNFAQTYDDRTLAEVMAKDKTSRDGSGNLVRLTEAEHMFRADVYMSNRQFASARDHWSMVIEHYPESASVPKALFGMGRSNMWERNYSIAVKWFDKVAKEFPDTPDGQEGLAFKGACYVRLGENLKAVEAYEKYTVMFPFGKRIESSHLNILDAYREAGEFNLANKWVDKTRKKFGGLPTETNALHARLRMEVYRQEWNDVVRTANDLLELRNFNGSMAFEYEIRYLKAFAMQKLGNKIAAIYEYSLIPADPSSYYGGLATDRLDELGADTKSRHELLKSRSASMAGSFPVKYKSELLRYARSRDVDPRFVLAIMKQESSFRANAKSPAAARGLLQLTFDTAMKFNRKAGFPNISAEDLYRPDINIAIGSVYLSELQKEFGGLYEAVAASYNGGEDNSSRWLDRSRPKEAAIFASEVGFSETKRYVYKVMSNYRIYKELYTEDLLAK